MSVDWKSKLKNKNRGEVKPQLEAPRTATEIIKPEPEKKVEQPTYILREIIKESGKPKNSYFERVIDANTFLRIDVWNSYTFVSGYAIQIFGSITDRSGQRKEFSDTIIPTSNRVINTKLITLSEGILGSFVCYPLVGTPKRGQTFIRASLVTGAGGLVKEVLFSGYISNERYLSFPISTIENSIDGFGNIVTLTPVNPAPGSGYLFTVPTNTTYKFRPGECTLVTDATVANRWLLLLYSSPTRVLYRFYNANNITAAQTLKVGVQSSGLSNILPSGLNFKSVSNSRDQLWMSQGYTFQLTLDNIQAGDQFSDYSQTFEELFEV